MRITKFISLKQKNMKECKETIKYIPNFLKKINNEGLAESTFKCRERHLDQFKKWLIAQEKENILPHNLSEKDIEKYKKFLKEEKKASKQTQKNYLRSLRFFFKFLEEKKIECPSSEKVRLEQKIESDIQKLVNYYFQTKGLSLEEIKKSAKKRKIIYSRHTKPAKQLLELAGSLKKAKKAIKTVADWAKSRNLDYAIETVLKKWPELATLKPKKKRKKPFYKGERMVKSRGKWYVIDDEGEWFEFAGDEKQIVWKEDD